MQQRKSNIKGYKAIVWTDDESVGKRISLLAETLEEAKRKLIIDYGPKATISLWNDEDANLHRNSKLAAAPIEN